MNTKPRHTKKPSQSRYYFVRYLLVIFSDPDSKSQTQKKMDLFGVTKKIIKRHFQPVSIS